MPEARYVPTRVTARQRRANGLQARAICSQGCAIRRQGLRSPRRGVRTDRRPQVAPRRISSEIGRPGFLALAVIAFFSNAVVCTTILSTARAIVNQMYVPVKSSFRLLHRN